MNAGDDLVTIYRPRDHFEAHAIKQALEAAGISCHIDGENLAALSSGGWMWGAAIGRMRIMVMSADSQRAEEVIRDHDCPSCGLSESEES